jgi:hypothetical protein
MREPGFANNLGVEHVSRAGSLRTALKQFNMPDSELENPAILNGMRLDDNVGAWTAIKIVAK